MFEIGQLTRLPLGYVGESNTRTIRIDMREWLKDFPAATIVVEVARPDRYKYLPAIEMEGGILTWVVNPGEVRITGKGFAQIAAIDLDTGNEYRSRVVETIIANSLEDFTDVELEDVDPAAKWVNKVLIAAGNASESEQAAENAANRAQQILDSIPLDYQEVLQGVAALSEETANLGESNCVNYIGIPEDIEETTWGGITYSCTDGVFRFSGTAENSFFVRLLDSPKALPAWWKPGKTIRIVYHKSDDNSPLHFRIYKYVDDWSITEIYTTKLSGAKDFTIPDDFDGLGIQIRLHVASGDTVDTTAKAEIYNKLSYDEIIEIVQEHETDIENDKTYIADNTVEIDMTPGRTDTACGFAVRANKSEARKLRGLILYGRTTQGSKPSLEQPVPMVNAVDSGMVTLSTHGKNLLPAEEEITFLHRYDITLEKPLAPGTYTVSATITSDDTDSSHCLFGFVNGASTGGVLYAELRRGKRSSAVVTTHNPVSHVFFNAGFDYEGSAGDTATYKQLQVEIGQVATDYEPYNSSESFVIHVPHPLAGILVADGGNYTTDDGVQYISDYLDLDTGECVKMIGRIDSYAGEDVGDIWMSTTGALSAGATVLYKLPQPIVTILDTEETAVYKKTLRAHYPTTSVTNDGGAGIRVSYAAIEVAREDASNGQYVAPVSQAWEQRMLERIEQCLVPMVALRDVPKCNSGYTPQGNVLTGINYSAVHSSEHGANLVGAQVALSTYYSALENPASKMYTEDKYQSDAGRSTYYGINCSGFITYIIGAKKYLYTELMMNMVADGTWSVVPVENENDIFKVKRGDILLNTVDGLGESNHVAMVRDAVHDAKTGRLIGFNIVQSARPYAMESFFTPAVFLDWIHDPVQPYKVVRLDDVRREDGTYSLDVEPIAYSRSVYPDKGDGGRYAAGEEIWLYMPHASETQTIIIYMDNGSTTTKHLSNLEFSFVNGVKVYKLALTDSGTYHIYASSSPGDPCCVLVGN